MALESECKNPQGQNPAPANNQESTNSAEQNNTKKEYTYEDLMRDDAEKRKKTGNVNEKPQNEKPEDGKKGRIFTSLYTFLSTTKTGKAICATTLALAIATGSMVYGAKNSSQVNGTVGRVSNVMYTGAGALTDKVDYVLNGNPQISEFLEKKKGEYEAVLKSEPTNAEAQKELTKLEALIGAYKQIYNSKE